MNAQTTKLQYALQRHHEGDEGAIPGVIGASIEILKSGTHDHHAVRLACQTIAIDGANGFTCPHGLKVPCMTNKVIRNHQDMGNITFEVMESALVPLPRCQNSSCPNHSRYRADAPTAEELAESGHLVSHSDYYPWE